MKNVKCRKCGNEFDLYKFGAPLVERDICWGCKPPTYAPARKMYSTCYSWAELDALEDRCLREEDD